MPSSSRRTTSVILLWVFKPHQTVDNVAAGFFQHLRPVEYCFPRQNGPFNSTRTDTCLPLSAASASAAMIGELPLTRYSVCLIASTSGSLGSFLAQNLPPDQRSHTGGSADISPLRILAKISSSFISAGTGCGVYGGVFKFIKAAADRYTFMRTVRSSGPSIS